jgi:hypothetical protein
MLQDRTALHPREDVSSGTDTAQVRGPLGGLADVVEVAVIMLVFAGVYLFFAAIYVRTELLPAVRRMWSRGG